MEPTSLRVVYTSGKGLKCSPRYSRRGHSWALGWIVGKSAWFGLCEGWTGQGCHYQVFLWVEFLGAAAVCECVFICLGGGWAWCEIAGMKSSTSVSDTTDPQPEKRDKQSDRWIWAASIRQSTTRVDSMVNSPCYHSTAVVCSFKT